MNESLRDARGFELVARADEVREMDRRTIEGLGVPGRVLMELAGAAAARHVAARVGDVPGRAVVLCGAGNNGGDGYVVARHLVDRGWQVVCIAAASGDGLGGDARVNHDLWVELGGEVRPLGARATAAMRHLIGHADVVVDALFGVGLSRPIEGALAELIAMANEASHGLRVAVDVPSGVDASTGQVLGEVVFRAGMTVTLGAGKSGLYTAPGADHAGEVAVVAIGIPRSVAFSVGASHRLATAEGITRLLPARRADGHKGTYGHVGVLGGFDGQQGAAELAARAALRVGAGLATWATPSEAPSRIAEIMHHDLRGGLPVRADVFVVGPGLGVTASSSEYLDAALADGRRLVLDADALNLLATASRVAEAAGHVITPHPREAARLLGTNTAAVQADRLAAHARLVAATGAVVILKGARSIVGGPEGPAVIFDLPTATLSAGGTGDVLAGAVAGLIAQGSAPLDAALVAVWLHAAAGRMVGLGRADRGALASEVADALPRAIDGLVKGWT